MGFFDFLGSLITGGMGVASSRRQNEANLQAVRETNEMNWEIAQMNNDFNERQFEKAQQYAVENYERQWNDTLENQWNLIEYNTPANQAQRFRDAGINPYLAMSGNNSGVATASAGGSYHSASPPTATPVQMQAPHYDYSTAASSIAAAVDQYLQSKKQDSEIDINREVAGINRIERQYRARKLMAQIQKDYADSDNTEARTFYQNLMNSLELDTYDSSVATRETTLANLRETNKSLRIRNGIEGMQLLNLPTQIKLDIAQRLADLNLTNVSVKQGHQMILKLFEETEGLRLDNKQKRELQEKGIIDELYNQQVALTMKYRAEAEKIDNNAGPEGMHGVPNFVYGLGKNILRAGHAGYDSFKSWYQNRNR